MYVHLQQGKDTDGGSISTSENKETNSITIPRDKYTSGNDEEKSESVDQNSLHITYESNNENLSSDNDVDIPEDFTPLLLCIYYV